MGFGVDAIPSAKLGSILLTVVVVLFTLVLLPFPLLTLFVLVFPLLLDVCIDPFCELSEKSPNKDDRLPFDNDDTFNTCGWGNDDDDDVSVWFWSDNPLNKLENCIEPGGGKLELLTGIWDGLTTIGNGWFTTWPFIMLLPKEELELVIASPLLPLPLLFPLLFPLG